MPIKEKKIQDKEITIDKRKKNNAYCHTILIVESIEKWTPIKPP